MVGAIRASDSIPDHEPIIIILLLCSAKLNLQSLYHDIISLPTFHNHHAFSAASHHISFLTDFSETTTVAATTKCNNYEKKAFEISSTLYSGIHCTVSTA